ncbi:MAG: hypothetical protein FH749_15290 [Firmicutes bacterium]|nr:hypothetical protein [Bacillota bacterium]
MKFVSPSHGEVSIDQVYQAIRRYMDGDDKSQYRLIIGTDSQVRQRTIYVTAVIIHRVGKGARYFYTKRYERATNSLRQRMYYETSLSLDVASRLTALIAREDETLEDENRLDLEIHLDIGRSGETRGLIRELVGMVIGSGFAARIKPHSFGASTVADKHTKT